MVKTRIEIINQLISDLKKAKIFFSEDNFEVDVTGVYGNVVGTRTLDNIILTDNVKTIKITKDLFYRKTGICKMIKTKTLKSGKELMEFIDVTDEMFYTTYKIYFLSIFNQKS